MKRQTILIPILGILLLSGCLDENKQAFEYNTEFSVAPSETDASYDSDDQDHYLVRNSKTRLNRLLVFIGGTYSRPDEFESITEHAAILGFDVISLSYPNEVSSNLLANSPDSLVFDHYRQEVVFGDDVSDQVSVDALNSIYGRTLRLLKYLRENYSNQKWGQYLTESDAFIWNKIVFVGHSEGAGFVGYLAKNFPLNRAVMLSGPSDYSTYYNRSAYWLSEESATPISQTYALLHRRDEVISYQNALDNVRTMDLLEADEDPVLADNQNFPYNNSNVLAVDIVSQFTNNHQSTVGENALLPAIWNYMMVNEN